MLSLRLHKERYEFQCDRSYNQQDMTKKNTPVKSLVCPTIVKWEIWVRDYVKCQHDHHHKKRDGF